MSNRESALAAPAAEPIYDPAILGVQLADIAGMTATVTPQFDVEVLRLLDRLDVEPSRVVVIGDGDSYIAAHAADFAFGSIARIRFDAVGAQRFLDYAVDWIPDAEAMSTVVVGVSASGGTVRVAEGLERARSRGAVTVALTGKPGRVSEAAQHVVLLTLPDKPRSPGVRTFNASCLGLFLLAIRLGQRTRRHDASRSAELIEQLLALGAASTDALRRAEAGVADLVERFDDAPVIAFLGSGPSHATALFAAAKVVEASGVMAFGQDLEEWHHVERYAWPLDMPIFVIAPPGRSSARAAEVVHEAVGLGRRPVLIDASGDGGSHQSGALRRPMPEVQAAEAFSPLLYHVGPTLFAAGLAKRLGRVPFQADLQR